MECRGRILEIEKLQDQTILDKARAILHHHKQIDGIRKARHVLFEAKILLLEADSEVEILKAQNSDITQQLEDGKKNLKAIVDELDEQRSIAAEARTAAVAILTDENRGDLEAKAADKSVDDVDQAIQVERAKLEVIQASNPTALEEYERYAARIERERANQENQEARIAELTERIDHIKTQWEPRVDQLVGQINDAFSYNFEQISCAGEVGVHKDEDFDKWAIEIKVKFRYVFSISSFSSFWDNLAARIQGR